jgi:hypothetical protein
MKKGNHYSLKVRSVFLLDIQKLVKAIDLFDLIPMKFLLEVMLNLMKISLPCEPSSMFVQSSIPIMVFSSYDDNENENPPVYSSSSR